MEGGPRTGCCTAKADTLPEYSPVTFGRRTSLIYHFPHLPSFSTARIRNCLPPSLLFSLLILLTSHLLFTILAMAAVLPLRHGILLNPSPTNSPLHHTISLPGTPHLIPSYSSLSSTASSSIAGSDVDNYFLTASSSRPSTSHSHHRVSLPAAPRPSTSDGLKLRTGSAPSASRRIRFAPLPDPRREVLVTEEGHEIPFPAVFVDETDQNLIPLRDFSPRTSLDRSGPPTPGSKALNPNSSLLLASPQHGISLLYPHDPSLFPPSSSNLESTPRSSVGDSPSSPAIDPTHLPCGLQTPPSNSLIPSHSDCQGASTPLLTKTSPQTLGSPALDYAKLDTESIKGSIKRSGNKGWKSKLFKPILASRQKDTTHSDEALSYGVNPLLKHSHVRQSYDHDDLTSVVSDKRRAESLREPTGVPFERSSTMTSTITTNSLPPTLASASALKPRKKSTKSHSLFSSPTATSLNLFSSGKSAKNDYSRSHSTGPQARTGPGAVKRPQVRMLNGRYYGARRVDPFSTIRYVPIVLKPRGTCIYLAFSFHSDQEPEFVEWGFGGMGSVSNSSSMWAKVQSNAGVSIGASAEGSWGGSTGSGTSSGGSGRGADDYDDGSGMAWVRRRREKKERERLETEEQEKKEAEERERLEREKAEKEKTDEGDVEESNTEGAEHISSSVVELVVAGGAKQAQDDVEVKDVKEEEEHVTTAVTVPAPSHRHSHHHSISSSHHRPSSSIDRASTIRNAPERRGSADTARGIPSSGSVVKAVDTVLTVTHQKHSFAGSSSADGEADDVTTSPDASANVTEDEMSSDSDSEEDEVCGDVSRLRSTSYSPFIS